MAMTCPPDVATVLLEILGQGLLQARSAAWAGDAAGAAVEADHVHNLPGLLAHFSPDDLEYYWETERSAYVARSTSDQAAGFAPLWARLRSHVDRLSPTAAR